jgi:phosphoribosylanthranilate isomerase
MSGLVKICGLTNLEHAEAAARAGADLIGLVFADSRRRVTPATARSLIERARSINPSIRAVGLFVDASQEMILDVHDESGIDLVQLHGMPPAESVERLGIPALLVVRDAPGRRGEELTRYIATVAQIAPVEMIMLDAYHPTLAGGTGTLSDWKLAAELARRVPLMLAGGLKPGNVEAAISTVRPAAVDVSSGVERMGTKDPALIRDFITNARSAFEANGYSTSSGTSSHDAP